MIQLGASEEFTEINHRFASNNVYSYYVFILVMQHKHCLKCSTKRMEFGCRAPSRDNYGLAVRILPFARDALDYEIRLLSRG